MFLFKSNLPKLKILQITDIHLDLNYIPGSIANCKDFLCCRADSVPINRLSRNITAGYWGSTNKCDVPIQLIESMFEHIATNEDVKMF